MKKQLAFLCAVLNCVGILGVVFHIAEPLLFGVFVTYFIMNWNADFLVGKLVKIIDVFQRKG